MNSLLSLYRLPTGRRLFCLGRVREVLEANGFQDLCANVERAITADEATRELEDQWRGSKGETEHAPEATRLHAELGRALAALDDTLGASLKAFGEDSPRGQSAAFARYRLFPKGVRHVTRMPFVEQQVAVATLLRRVQSDPELNRQVKALGVQLFVDRVAEVNALYAQKLQVKDASSPSYEDVLEARREGQERLSLIVILLAARMSSSKLREAQQLAKALHAVLEQNAAIKRHRRRRRGMTDVDPETGEEIGTDEGGDEGEEADVDSAEDPPPDVGERQVASPLSAFGRNEADAA